MGAFPLDSLSSAYGAQGRPDGTSEHFMNGSFFIQSHVANDAVMRERNSHAPKWACFRSRGTSVGVFQLFVAKMTGPAYIHTLYYYSYSVITSGGQ